MYNEFTKRNTIVIAVSQEDTALDSHARFLNAFETKPPFDIVADLNHKDTPRYHQTTTYLIDREGVVRQVFPMMVRYRAPWSAVLGELDRIGIGQEPKVE